MKLPHPSGDLLDLFSSGQFLRRYDQVNFPRSVRRVGRVDFRTKFSISRVQIRLLFLFVCGKDRCVSEQNDGRDLNDERPQEG